MVKLGNRSKRSDVKSLTILEELILSPMVRADKKLFLFGFSVVFVAFVVVVVVEFLVIRPL